MNFSVPSSSPPSSVPAYHLLKRSRPPNQTSFNPTQAPPLPKINGSNMVLQTFTHPSLRRRTPNMNSDDYDDNERLSDLGKVVLDTVVTHILFKRRPMLKASEICDKRNRILSDESFDDWVSCYGLRTKIRCHPNHSSSLNTSRETRSIFYAYVGAIFLESGSDPVQDWVEGLIGNESGLIFHPVASEPLQLQRAQTPPMKKVKAETPAPAQGSPIFFAAQPPPSPLRHPPPHLQPPALSRPPNPLAPAQPNLPFLPLFNQTAAQRRVSVDYPAEFIGPPHAGQWSVLCIVNGIVKGMGTGSTKQTAKEEAARQAYYAMGWT